MALELLLPPGPTPSCRVDYATWTFKLRSLEACENLLNLGWSVGHHVLPNGDMSHPRKGKHFSEVRSHDSGVTVELTPPDSDLRNAGLGVLTVPGSVWAALARSERIQLYIEVADFEGFFRCTRLDTQFTILDPPLTIYDFVNQVQDGNIWAKNYSCCQADAQFNRAGAFRRPPTMYFGTPDSPTRARIYSHGAKHGWEEPDIRFEVQQRKQNATDTFIALLRLARQEVLDEPLLLVREASLVYAVSREKLDLRDTTGIDREALGGKWLRKAPRVSWYADLVDAPEVPIERRSRPTPSIESSMDSCTDQYHGVLGGTALRTMAVDGATLPQASEAILMRQIGRMKLTDLQRAKAGLEPAQQAEVDRIYRKLSPEASRMAEHCWVAEREINPHD